MGTRNNSAFLENSMRRRFIRLVAVTAPLIVVVLSTAPGSLAELSGKADYMTNCAGCHGEDGKGKGRNLYVIPGIAPADLTQLAKKNGGVFPFQETEDAIDGRKYIAPSHERLDMPFWGVTMQSEGKEFSAESDAMVKARIDAMVRYIESIQAR